MKKYSQIESERVNKPSLNINFSLKTVAILFYFGFLFFGLANTASAATIDGSTWPTSGAASAGTTGFSAITGGTHVGSTDLPPGSTATGYITGTDNTTLSFRVDSTTVPLQSDNDYWLRYWIRASRNGTTLAADGASVSHHYIIYGSTKLTNIWYLRNTGVSNGFGFNASEFLPGGTKAGIISTDISGVPAMLPFNQWSEITLHLHKDGKDGEYAMYFNRSLVALRKNIPTTQHRSTFTADTSTDTITSIGHGMVEGEAVTLTTTETLPAGLSTTTTYYARNPSVNTFQLSLSSSGAILDITDVGTGTHTYDNGGISLAALGSQWLMSLTGVNGITWQVAGPISTSSQATIANTPLVDTFTTSNDWVTKVYPASYNNLTYGGDFWTQTAGDMAVNAIDYCSAGICPYSKRFQLSGSSSNTATLATNMDIGTLPFNSDGWATLFFPMIYLPSSGALNIIIKDTVGNSIYQVDINDSFLKQAGTNKAPWVQTDRYFLALHFSNTGMVNYSMHDLTADVTSQNFWSGQLIDWTPQAIGRVNYLATRGTANLELDGLAVARWLPLFGLDSITAAPANSLTPVLTTVNHVTQGLFIVNEGATLPGAMYKYKANNIPRFFNWGIIGRQGRTRQNFTDNILPYMNYSKGIVMTFIDGGSINDIGPIGSSETFRTTVVNRLISQLSSAISQLTGSQNRVWMSTMINRVQGSTYTATQRNAILDYNAGIRSLRLTFPSTYFSDPATDIADPSALFTAGDDTHFNAAGDITVATNMVTGMLNNPPTYSVGGTTTGLTGTVVLQNNSGNNLSISANGSFVFTTTLNDLSSYNVTALTQPTNQTCTVGSSSGTVSSANVTSITVTCVSTLTAITSFNFANPAVIGTVDNNTHTITLTVPFGTTLTSLTPTIVLATGALISPTSGVAQDFSSSITYTVTAQDEVTTQDYTVAVTVAPDNTHTITSTASDNGSITPPDESSVTDGDSQTFTITPNSGYAIADVLVDGESVGDVTTYEFTNVITDHTISATFVAFNTPTLTLPASSTITSTTATLGANITSLGIPASLSARGICYGTTTSPSLTDGTSTCAIEGDTNIGIFTKAITGLSPGTQYHYRGYATNSTGTAYSPDATFYAAPVLDQDQGSIIPDTGGTLDLIAEDTTGITLDIPVGATQDSETPVTYQIKALSQNEVFTSSGTPSGLLTAGDYAFDLKALTDIGTAVTNFLAPLEISLHYQDSDITGIREGTLLIYRYDGSTWTPLTNCVVNTEANTITCTTIHFSVFSLFGQASGGGGGGSGGGGHWRPTPTTKTPAKTTPAQEQTTRKKAFSDFLTKTLTENKRTGFATRLETVLLSLTVQGTPILRDYTCQKLHTDTFGKDVPSYTCQVAEKARAGKIISQTNTEFNPLLPVSRIEAYAIMMKSICVMPETTNTSWQQEVIKKAIELGFTVRTLDTFEPDRPLSIPEMYTVVQRLSEYGKGHETCKG